MNRTLAIFLALVTVAPLAAGELSLASPDRSVRLLLRDGVRTGYEVTFKGKSVIASSPLGIIVDGAALAEGVRFGRPAPYQTDESYPWYGVHSIARDRSNGIRLPVTKTKTGVAYTIEARAYNEGVAFRLIVPGDEGKPRVPEYNLLEGFWQKWTPEQLKELVDYSRERKVGIWLWKHSRDLRDPAARRKFFELCRDAGVVGAKIDFFDHEAKEVVEHYETLLREAAAYHILVNFHGANKPAGESRTFPNELTREAIRGMEARRALRAEHDATLPFTRMLAGHADYTPVLFGERRNDTTWAHQAATAAVFTSPLLVYGAHPASILQNPAAEIIKSIPSVWDETIALPFSEIGGVAAFARRRDDIWFVAILNGPQARNVDVALPFLSAGTHHGLLARDSQDDPAAVRIEKGNFERGASIRVDMRSGGGFIARFSK